MVSIHRLHYIFKQSYITMYVQVKEKRCELKKKRLLKSRLHVIKEITSFLKRMLEINR